MINKSAHAGANRRAGCPHPAVCNGVQEIYSGGLRAVRPTIPIKRWKLSMKKLISLLLAAVMLTGKFTLAALAASDTLAQRHRAGGPGRGDHGRRPAAAT